jgi:hypothetical protein
MMAPLHSGASIEQQPPPFVAPPLMMGSWQDQYASHVAFFRAHFAAQLTSRPAEPLSAHAHEEFLHSSEALWTPTAAMLLGA